VLRHLTVLTLLLVACKSTSQQTDAPLRDSTSIDSLVVDAPPPPPSVDAGPPPTVACGSGSGSGSGSNACELPPSTCLDEHYLDYYTGGTCNAGTCEFTSNLLYCPIGCINGGCEGGFT
jgi:hypothetical protein